MQDKEKKEWRSIKFMNEKGANMKRATAKIITILLMITMATAITGCSDQNETTESSEALASPTDHEGYDTYDSDINKNIFEYVDPETGVHYLLLVRKDGYGGMGGITPRLDKSGQVMIDKEE